MENVQVAALDTQRTYSHEAAARAARWHSFQVIFCLLYMGIMLDIATTAMGFGKAGDAYEQNPVGAFLIEHMGWLGLVAVLSGFATLLYFSCRVLYSHLRATSTRWISGVLAAATFLRWLAVVTAILYLVQG